MYVRRRRRYKPTDIAMLHIANRMHGIAHFTRRSSAFLFGDTSGRRLMAGIALVTELAFQRTAEISSIGLK